MCWCRNSSTSGVKLPKKTVYACDDDDDDDDAGERGDAGMRDPRPPHEHGRLTDVARTDLFGDLNVGPVDRPEEQAAVEAEFHVGRPRGLGAGRRDVLADVRGRDQHLSQGDRVVGEEEDAEVVFGVRVGVDHAGGVDDQADGLGQDRVSNLGRPWTRTWYQFGDVILGSESWCQRAERAGGQRDAQPGAAFPAKKTFRGTAFFLSSGVIAFNIR